MRKIRIKTSSIESFMKYFNWILPLVMIGLGIHEAIIGNIAEASILITFGLIFLQIFCNPLGLIFRLED